MDILKTMRNKIGLSQQDMANLLGVTRQLYSMIETGKRTLPAEAQIAALDTFITGLEARKTALA